MECLAAKFETSFTINNKGKRLVRQSRITVDGWVLDGNEEVLMGDHEVWRQS